MSPESLEWLWRIGGLVGLLVGVIYGWMRWDQRRMGKAIHDLRNVVNRHEQWITVIREKLGMGPRE